MTRLDRYLLLQVLSPAVLALLVIGFLAASNEIRERAAQLPREVVGISDLGLLAILFLPSVLAFVIPAAYMFGILLGFGRLGTGGELAAMSAAGISASRLAAPIVVVGAVLSLGCVLIQERIQPRTVDWAYALLEEELPQRLTLDRLEPGVMHEYGDWRVYFSDRDVTTHTLFGVDIVRPDERGEPWVFHSDSARLAEVDGARVLTLINGNFVSPENLRSDFAAQELTIPQQRRAISSKRLRLGRTLAGLLESERALAQQFEHSSGLGSRMGLVKERQEIADRVSLPFAAFAVSLAGVPFALGSVGRRRGSRARLFFAGLGVLVVYYLSRGVLEPRSLHDLDDYVLRAWIPNVVLIALGGFLLWRLDRSGVGA